MNYRLRSCLPAMIVLIGCLLPLSSGVIFARTGASLRSSREVLSAFRDPPAEYRSAPLWVWNDRMTREEIDDQLADLHNHGIGGVFIHPRPGLITPYLSSEWLSLWRHAVDAGKKLGMKIWIYDENSYPSGFAGGHVPAQMPDAKRTGLRMTRTDALPRQLPPETVRVLRRDTSGFSDITSQIGGAGAGPGDYRIFSLIREKPRPWYGGFTYVDIMRPEVTETFIDITLNAYKRVIGREFGGAVPGVFEDEAEISPAGEPGALVVNYTPALFERFRMKWGYDLAPVLPSLYEEVGEWRRVRHDFFATTLELFIEGWARPYHDYCEANRLLLTGHYWEHEWPRPVVNPDNMAFAAYAHVPGIDILMNDLQMNVHAQFGNARAVREIRSVANQLGKVRTLSETFGAGGWDMSFADQKRIADWEYALGVNLLCQHLSYATITGARKRDHPLSFSYHEPWWDSYRVLADYYGRLTVALCAGEQLNRILVIEPTTTGWMYASPERENRNLDTLGRRFQDFVHTLEAAQIEYDLASEYILRFHSRAGKGALIVGKRTYDLLVLPPGLENLDAPTFALIRSYVAGGGKVVSCGDPPGYVDGREDVAITEFAARHRARWVSVGVESALKTIGRLSPPAVAFCDSSGSPASSRLLFHQRRVLDDCELLFLANTESAEYRSGQIRARALSCEQWDPFTGSVVRYPCEAGGGRLTFAYSVPPGGSLLLCLRRAAVKKLVPLSLAPWSEVPAQGEMTARRKAPNVLTLDYCDLKLADSTEKDLYFYQAQQMAYQHHGFDRNPWDNAVQYGSSIIDRDTCGTGSGFEATFHFTVAEGVSKESLRAAVERPGLFQVSVNGSGVDPVAGAWWLDKSFALYEIGPLLHTGKNDLTVRSSPFTVYSELEPVYILGDFSLHPCARGFEMVQDQPVRKGPWSTQGMPFYGHGVSYTRQFGISGPDLSSRQFVVSLNAWRGAVAEIEVNGVRSGSVAFAPFELDVTRFLKPGVNTVSVTVVGTLKNTLGPHHNAPPLGRAWPSEFQKGAAGGVAPGSEYSTVGYGLLDGFSLRSRAR